MPVVHVEDATLYYEVHGTGPALVFAHGAGSNTLIWWQQVAHFASDHTVVTFDHRSYGRSTCAVDKYHPRYFSGHLQAILDAARIERAALVGQSLGGWTSLRAAIDMPERVACLVLSGSPAGVDTDMIAGPSARAFARLAASTATREELSLSLALAPDFPRREPARALLYTQIGALNGKQDRGKLAALFEARVEPADLVNFACPSLFLFGELDAFFGPHALRQVAKQVPRALTREFPGVGHSPYWEVPEVFNQVVADFIRPHLAA